MRLVEAGSRAHEVVGRGTPVARLQRTAGRSGGEVLARRAAIFDKVSQDLVLPMAGKVSRQQDLDAACYSCLSGC
jgi:hypothetical protein